MSEEIRLDPGGQQALKEAQMFCYRANVAIVAAEHLLAGALAVLSDGGRSAVPGREALEGALTLAQGSGDESLSQQVMFGSAARDAINTTAARLREAGGSVIDAGTLALGVIDSGEVSPMFYGSLGTTRAALRASVAGGG
jgi:hypothetical protein